jgi:hypothetical protein
VLALVTGLSQTRSQTSIELLHLGLQLLPEGGPHFTRFGTRFRPYKHKQVAPIGRWTGLTAGSCCGH